MDALAVDELPEGEWLYEIKFDGYRTQAAKQNGETTVYSRSGNVFNEKFPIIVHAIEELGAKEFILDGEVVALTDEGTCDFHLLQNARSNQDRLHFYAFDLLAFEGKDLTRLSLARRRAILEREFPSHGRFHISPLFTDPDQLLDAVKAHGFEGVVAKRKFSLYEGGERSGAWQKKKTQQSDDFLVGGYLPGNSGLSELVVGRKGDDGLMYWSSVKSGFVPRVKGLIREALHGMDIDDCPFVNLPEESGSHRFDADKMAKTIWVRPKILAEIAYNNVTPDGRLRNPKFLRLRDEADVRPAKRRRSK